MFRMSRKLTSIAVLTLLVALTTAACSSDNKADSGSAPAEAAAGVREVTDQAGNTMTIPVKPERIVATGLEDYLVALEVKPVVRYPYAYLDAYLSDVPQIQFTPGLTPETALSFSPDLIVFGYPPDEEQYKSFSQVAPTYVFTDVWTEDADWRQVMRNMGELFGRTDIAEAKLTAYETKLADTKRKIADSVGEAKAVMLYIGKTIWVMGKDKKDVLYDLGFQTTKLETEYGSDEISLELLPELADADYIFLQTDEEASADEQQQSIADLEANPLWAALPAVKNGNVNVGSSAIWRGNGYVSNSEVLDEVIKTVLK